MIKRPSDSNMIPGIIEGLDASSLKHSTNPRSEIIHPYDLASSINQKGLLQPIVVRAKEEYFEIVAGNRRFDACKLLGWKKIPCHIVELDDREAFETSLIENIQRQSLNPLDEAKAFKCYVDDFGWGGMTELAKRLGKNPSYITKRIKLLDLPSDVRESITKSKISPSAAEELISLDKSQQSALAMLIGDRHLSISKTRLILRNIPDNYGIERSEYTKFQPICDEQMKYDDQSTKISRSFDKCIIALKIGLHRIGAVIEDNEDDWVMHEILMQHKAMIHAQIDLLIKQKQRRKRSFKKHIHLQ
jgi:ParB family transcriptional regulator, chromosome partitioning protein